MRQTPVYIVCSPRPRVGKTLVARLLTEFLYAEHHGVAAFDINANEPSLIDYLPRVTQTADISDTRGQMALMDGLIEHDEMPKVIDLGAPSFDGFFRMAAEIGFFKEALRRDVLPIVLFIADGERATQRAFEMVRDRFPEAALVAVDNEHITWGEVSPAYRGVRQLRIAALPPFFKSIIERPTFSFTQFLRDSQDPSAELHQWTRKNFLAFREMTLNLLLDRLRIGLR